MTDTAKKTPKNPQLMTTAIYRRANPALEKLVEITGKRKARILTEGILAEYKRVTGEDYE